MNRMRSWPMKSVNIIGQCMAYQRDPPVRVLCAASCVPGSLTSPAEPRKSHLGSWGMNLNVSTLM